jgi:GT2 family glycosyltransferase
VTDTPTVSVIIVSWNALPLLRKCLPSVAASEWPGLEVVLADNGSDDGSAEWVEAQLPGVRIVRHPENWGFCRGNNEAIRQTTSEFVVLLNNDVEVTAGWLAPLVERMQGDPTIGAVQPKILAYDDRGRFEYAGAGGGYLDRWGYPFARGRIFFTLEEDRGQYDRSTDVFWGSGAALMLRRDTLGQVGLLDERFGFHMEEIDLCWRLHRAGWRVVAEPASVVYHVGGGSLPQGHPRKTYLNFRNSLLMLYKNLSPRAWRRVLPVLAPGGRAAGRLGDRAGLRRCASHEAGVPGEAGGRGRAVPGLPGLDRRRLFPSWTAALLGPSGGPLRRARLSTPGAISP